jgi:hypothetical protein
VPALAARRRARNPQIVTRTKLVPLAAAREVLDEAARWLGVSLPSRYAVRLAAQAHIVYANSPSFRRALARPGDAGRDRVYAFMRHWLAARMLRDQPVLFAALPPGYRAGAEPPVPTPKRPRSHRSGYSRPSRPTPATASIAAAASRERCALNDQR